MIHEVMVLDHGGIDFAYIQYGAMLKLWALGGLAAAILVPRSGSAWVDTGHWVAAMACVVAAHGVAESVMARLRLARVPQLLVAGIAMSALALALALVTGDGMTLWVEGRPRRPDAHQPLAARLQPALSCIAAVSRAGSPARAAARL